MAWNGAGVWLSSPLVGGVWVVMASWLNVRPHLVVSFKYKLPFSSRSLCLLSCASLGRVVLSKGARSPYECDQLASRVGSLT